MNEANAALENMIARLRGMRDMAKEIAVEATPSVEAIVRKTAAAGTDIEGTPWPPKKDGTRALPNAASAVTATALGVVIILSLKGGYVFHNSAAGEHRRRILPEIDIPPAIARAIVDAGSRVWRKRSFARAA